MIFVSIGPRSGRDSDQVQMINQTISVHHEQYSALSSDVADPEIAINDSEHSDYQYYGKLNLVALANHNNHNRLVIVNEAQLMFSAGSQEIVRHNVDEV